MTFIRNLFRRPPEPELGRTARELLSLLGADDWETDGDRELTYKGPLGPDVRVRLFGTRKHWATVLVNDTNLFLEHEHDVLFRAALATRDRAWAQHQDEVRKAVSAQAERLLFYA